MTINRGEQLLRIEEVNRCRLGIMHSVLFQALGEDDWSVRRLGYRIDQIDAGNGDHFARPYAVYGHRAMELIAGLDFIAEDQGHIYSEEANEMLAEIAAPPTTDRVPLIALAFAAA